MYLGIDLGTGSLKAVVYDPERREVVAAGACPLDMRSGADGSREQEAEWWLAALGDAVAQLPRREKAAVRAIGVSGQQHGFVPLAADGTVLAPVKLWCDTSTTAQCDEITAAFGGRQLCLEEVGNPILPGYTAAKILWLKQRRRADYDRLATVLLPHDYINYHLTGERYTEAGDASGTGYFDIRARQWHGGMLRAIDPDRDLLECMPRLVGPGEIGVTLLPAVAESLGLPAGLPVACGGGDNMMAALATGTVTAGCLTVSLGTSGTMFACADAPVVDAEGELAAFCSSTGGWLPLLCTMNCTVATERARMLLGMDAPAFAAAIDASPPGAGGLIALPFFNGERTPNLPRGKGCFVGMDMDNATPTNMARAAMEGAVFGLRTGLAALRRNGIAPRELRLTGGAARSQTWRQAVADNLKLPVATLANEEGAAFGAALNGMLAGSSVYNDAQRLAAAIEPHVAFAHRHEPDGDAAAVYDARFEDYQRYLRALAPQFT